MTKNISGDYVFCFRIFNAGVVYSTFPDVSRLATSDCVSDAVKNVYQVC